MIKAAAITGEVKSVKKQQPDGCQNTLLLLLPPPPALSTVIWFGFVPLATTRAALLNTELYKKNYSQPLPPTIISGSSSNMLAVLGSTFTHAHHYSNWTTNKQQPNREGEKHGEH